MQVYLVLAVACVVAQAVYGQGAGRAVPIASENYVIQLFKGINRQINYDTTNFLVDLSGNYANCNNIGQRQVTTINRRTPDDQSIGLIQDYTYGDQTHTQAVEGYLKTVFDSWVARNGLPGAVGQISAATKFGCSVRPGCNGQVSVACLFSPAGQFPNAPPPQGEQVAKAFTPEQYGTAEAETHQHWDNTYFLENLSGFETKCSLLTKLRDIPNFKHDFDFAVPKAREYGVNVEGLWGVALNQEDVPKALTEIMHNMKRMRPKQVGCSLIPDCMVDRYDGRGRRMWVVVTCIFEV